MDAFEQPKIRPNSRHLLLVRPVIYRPLRFRPLAYKGGIVHEADDITFGRGIQPTAYTPAGKLVTLLPCSRFHRLRFQQVKSMNSPLDPRLTEYWEDRRVQALFRRALADAHKRRTYLLQRQNYRCAITGLPLEDSSEIVTHLIVPQQAGGHDNWSNLCLVHQWALAQLHARLRKDRSIASLKDVPFSGI